MDRDPAIVGIRLLAALLIAGPVAGCGKDNSTGPVEKPPPFIYPALDTPQHVLWNLKYSWERRDSVRTRQIYDDGYVGTSMDQADPGSGMLTFSKNQEVAVVGTMAKSSDIVRVSVEFKPDSTWIRLTYANDPQGWTALQLNGANIQVDDMVHGTLTANSSHFEFKLVPTVDHSSPTDTTWKIVRWTEVKQ